MRTQTKLFSLKTMKSSFFIFLFSILLAQVSFALTSYNNNMYSSLGVSAFPKATTSGRSIVVYYNSRTASMRRLDVPVGSRQIMEIEIPKGVSAGYAVMISAKSWLGATTKLYPAPALPDTFILNGGPTTGHLLYEGSIVTAPIYAHYVVDNKELGVFSLGAFTLEFVVEDVAAYNTWLESRGGGQQTPVDDTPTYTPPSNDTPTDTPPSNDTSTDTPPTNTGTGSFGCGEGNCVKPEPKTSSSSSSAADIFVDALSNTNRTSNPASEPDVANDAANDELNRIEVIQTILMELVSGLSSEDILVDGDRLTVTLDDGVLFATLEESNLPVTVADLELSSVEASLADNMILTITFLNNNFTNREGMLKLKPTSYNPAEISDFLREEFADLVKNVTVTDDGEMIIKTSEGNYSASFDYNITPVGFSKRISDTISFELLQDMDGDGQDDLWVHYADGISQVMFFRTPGE
jgi:hypothetical protein